MSADKLAKALQGLLEGNVWRELQGDFAWHEKTMPTSAALTAGRLALEQHEAEKQEPVAWMRRFQIGEDDFDAETLVGQTHPNELGMDCLAHNDWEPLYASPQQEPDRLDADRYRWLRDPENGGAFSVGQQCSICDEYPKYEEVSWYYGIELDGLIDAAKEAKP